jgi:type I restriction enzyme S subunit
MPLGNVATCQYGLSEPADPNGDRLYIGMGQLQSGRVMSEGANRLTVSQKDAEKYALDVGDVLFNRTNSLELVGKTAIVDDPRLLGSVFASYLVRLKIDRARYDPRFLNIWMNTHDSIMRLRRLATPGVAQYNIRPSLLVEKFLIPAWPLSKQRAVADVEALFRRVSYALDAQGAAKRTFKRGLMQQLLTGRQRFPEYENSTWTEVTLGEAFVERNETNRDDLPLLSVTADRGVIPRNELDKRDTSNPDKSKYRRVAVGDIAYNTMRMWQGVSALVSVEGIVSPAYTVVVPTEAIDGRFAKHLFKFPPVVHLFYRHSQGLVDDTLNLKYERFSKIKLTIPRDRGEQKRIAATLDLCDAEIDQVVAHREKIDSYKHALLSKLLSGELQVPA